MSKPIPLFRTPNWSSYSRALKRRGSLMVWFAPEMAWFAVPGGKAGHPERFVSGGHTLLPLDQGAFRGAAPSKDRVCGEPAGPVWPRLAPAGLHHALPPADRSRTVAPVGPRKPAKADRCRSHIVRRPGRCISRWTSSHEAATGSRPWRDGIKFSGIGEWPIRRENDPPDRFLVRLIRKHGASRRRARLVSPLVRATMACGARSTLALTLIRLRFGRWR